MAHTSRPPSRPRSRPTALVAALALLLSALGPPGAPAARAAAPSRAVTTPVTISVPASVTGGDRVVVRARARTPERGRWMRLEVRRGGAWRVVDRDRQDARGRVALELRRPAWGSQAVRVVRAGPRPASSPVRTVRVRPVVSLAVAPIVPVGEPVEAVVRAVPARRGAPVALQELRDGAWMTVTSGPLDAGGAARLEVDPATGEGVRALRVVTRVPGVAGGPVASAPAYVRAASGTDVVSRRPDGTIADIAAFYGSDISADGRFVAFAAPLEGLTGQDVSTSIVVRDRLTDALGVVPMPAGAVAGDPRLSTDGRVLAYRRRVPDPGPEAQGSEWQLVVRDLPTGLERVLRDYEVERLDMSADGRRIVVEGTVLGPAGGCPGQDVAPLDDAQVYVVDAASGRTVCLPVRRPGVGVDESTMAQVSADGSTVAVLHQWRADRFAPGFSGVEVFRDGQDPLHLDLGPREGRGARIGLSGDGRLLVVEAPRPGQPDDELRDVTVIDLRTGLRLPLTAGYLRGGSAPVVSDDGRVVVFRSTTPELGGAGRSCLYRHDLLLGTTDELVCRVTGEWGGLSGDGTSVVTEQDDPDRYPPLVVTTKPLGGPEE